MDRNVRPLAGSLRGAGPALAAAVSAVLLLGACSSDSAGDSAAGTDDAPAADEPGTPEEVRYAELPNACETLGDDIIDEVVPEAGEEKELPSADVAATSACIWSGLDGYDFRSLTVTLKRFDSDPALGGGDARAETFLQAQTAEIADDPAVEDVVESAPEGVGDQAVGLAFTSEKTSGDSERDFRQQRMVVRTANAVVTVDYAGTGFEDADLPSADAIEEGAERVASEVVAYLESQAADGGAAEEESGKDD